MLWVCTNHSLPPAPRSNDVTRREGFPSWSWAGWIAHIGWVRLTQKRLKLWTARDLPTRMWTHTMDGVEVNLTDDMLENLHRTRASELSLYTYRLGMDAYIVDISTSHTRYRDDHDVDCRYVITKEVHGVRRYATRSSSEPSLERLEDCNDNDIDIVIWPVDFTEFVQEGSTLHVAFCTRKVQCAVMYGHYGLVLLTTDGVSERVGVVDIDANWVMPAERYMQDRSRPVSSNLAFVGHNFPHPVRCLKEQFPGRRMTVLLE
jgi:hypothetical protein